MLQGNVQPLLATVHCQTKYQTMNLGAFRLHRGYLADLQIVGVGINYQTLPRVYIQHLFIIE